MCLHERSPTVSLLWRTRPRHETVELGRSEKNGKSVSNTKNILYMKWVSFLFFNHFSKARPGQKNSFNLHLKENYFWVVFNVLAMPIINRLISSMSGTFFISLWLIVFLPSQIHPFSSWFDHEQFETVVWLLCYAHPLFNVLQVPIRVYIRWFVVPSFDISRRFINPPICS